MIRVLITGGAGFIGSRLSRVLLYSGQNYKIYVLDNLLKQVHGEPPISPESTEKFVFKLGSITDRETVRSVLRESQPDFVYHLAAETGTGQSQDELVRYNEVNVIGTAILLEELKKLSIKPRKVILSSSRAVYGEGSWITESGRVVVAQSRESLAMKQGKFTPTFAGETILRPQPAAETSTVSPVSVYASTKLMQEFLCLQGGEGKWRTVIFRFQNVYGPGQSLNNPYTGVLSIFCNQVLRDQTLNIFEDGQIERDFVYVDDVVAALVKPLLNDSADGQIVNIGSGKPVTILRVAKEILIKAGKPTDRLFVSGEFRIGDIRHACADITKAKALLGWQPTISIEEGISHLLDWARSLPKTMG